MALWAGRQRSRLLHSEKAERSRPWLVCSPQLLVLAAARVALRAVLCHSGPVVLQTRSVDIPVFQIQRRLYRCQGWTPGLEDSLPRGLTTALLVHRSTPPGTPGKPSQGASAHLLDEGALSRHHPGCCSPPGLQTIKLLRACLLPHRLWQDLLLLPLETSQKVLVAFRASVVPLL